MPLRFLALFSVLFVAFAAMPATTVQAQKAQKPAAARAGGKYTEAQCRRAANQNIKVRGFNREPTINAAIQRCLTGGPGAI